MTLSTSSSDTSGRIMNMTSYLRIPPPAVSQYRFGQGVGPPGRTTPRESTPNLRRRRLPLVVAVHRLLQTLSHNNRHSLRGAVDHVHNHFQIRTPKTAQ